MKLADIRIGGIYETTVGSSHRRVKVLRASAVRPDTDFVVIGCNADGVAYGNVKEIVRSSRQLRSLGNT